MMGLPLCNTFKSPDDACLICCFALVLTTLLALVTADMAWAGWGARAKLTDVVGQKQEAREC